MTSLAIQAVEKTQTTTENNAITTTSTPTSDTKRSSSSKSSSTKKKADMSRLYALYNDAKTRKEKRRESKKKYDDQTGCTFQPTLHKSSSRFNMKKSSMKNKNDKNSPSTTNKSNRFHRLYEQATESQRKKKERIAATPYNCTFKPKLSKKSASYRPKFKGTVGDRLHFQATETQQKKKEMEKVEGLRGCTFQPKLNKKAKASSRTSLYDLNQIKQKKILLEQRRMESEIRGCTFSPSLAPKTERITEKVSNRTTTTPENNAVYNRLHSNAKRHEEKMEEMRRARVDNSMAECSFKPKLSHNSKIDKKLSNRRAANGEIGNRLYEQGKRSMEKKKKLIEDDKVKFKNLSHTRNTSKKDQAKLFNRLYEQGKKKIQKQKNSPEYKSLANAKMEAMDLRECTFKPAKISNIGDASLNSDRYTPPLSKMRDGSNAKRSLKMKGDDNNNDDVVVVRKVITRSSLSPKNVVTTSKDDDKHVNIDDVISADEINSALNSNNLQDDKIESNSKQSKQQVDVDQSNSAIDMLSNKVDDQMNVSSNDNDDKALPAAAEE